jgi:hypothetical protein
MRHDNAVRNRAWAPSCVRDRDAVTRLAIGHEDGRGLDVGTAAAPGSAFGDEREAPQAPALVAGAHRDRLSLPRELGGAMTSGRVGVKV